jgi:competence protein ComEA
MTHSRYKTTFNREKIIRLLIIAIIVLSALFVFIMRTGDNNIKLDKSDIKSEEQISEKTGDDQGTETSSDVVICDVSGAVKTPKVVELKKGSRISDAIDAAGGLTKTADISNINRAAIVNDGDKILIPEEGKPQTDTQVNSGQTIRSSNTDNSHTESGLTSGKISINNADSTQLQTINGVGPVTADKIIAFREQNGGFTKIEQLKEISGIGDKTFEKMKDQVSL